MCNINIFILRTALFDAVNMKNFLQICENQESAPKFCIGKRPIFLFLGIALFFAQDKKRALKHRSVGYDDEIGCMAQHSRYLGKKRKRTQYSLYGTTQAVFWNILLTATSAPWLAPNYLSVK